MSNKKIKCIKPILVCAVILIQQVVLAQNIEIESVEQAMEIAIRNNIDYQNYLLHEKRAVSEYKQSKKYQLPDISGSFSGQKNHELATTPLPGEVFGVPGQTIEAQFGQEYTYNAGITISKELINRQANLQLKLSNLNTESKKAETALFKQMLKEQVIRYYYTGIIAEKAISLSENELENALKINVITVKRHEEGLEDMIAVNNARINENFVHQNLNSNKQLLLQCQSELKKLLGMESKDTLVLKGELNYDTHSSFNISQFRESPTLKTVDIQKQQADLQVKLSRSYLLPTIQLNSYFGKQQFRDDFGLKFSENAWSDYSYTSLSVSVPIFTGFNNRSKIKQNKYNQQIAVNEKQQAEKHSHIDDMRLIREYELSIADADNAREQFYLYDQNRKLYFQKYEEGLIGLENYLSIFQEYIKAENAYLNAISKAYIYFSQISPIIMY